MNQNYSFGVSNPAVSPYVQNPFPNVTLVGTEINAGTSQVIEVGGATWIVTNAVYVAALGGFQQVNPSLSSCALIVSGGIGTTLTTQSGEVIVTESGEPILASGSGSSVVQASAPANAPSPIAWTISAIGTTLTPGAALANIGTGNITPPYLASGAALANIGTGNITGTYLANATVTGTQIASGAVAGTQLATGAAIYNIGARGITTGYLAPAESLTQIAHVSAADHGACANWALVAGNTSGNGPAFPAIGSTVTVPLQGSKTWTTGSSVAYTDFGDYHMFGTVQASTPGSVTILCAGYGGINTPQIGVSPPAGPGAVPAAGQSTVVVGDDEPFIVAAMAEAASLGGGLVEISSAYLGLSATITTPPGVYLRCTGQGGFVPVNSTVTHAFNLQGSASGYGPLCQQTNIFETSFFGNGAAIYNANILGLHAECRGGNHNLYGQYFTATNFPERIWAGTWKSCKYGVYFDYTYINAATQGVIRGALLLSCEYSIYHKGNPSKTTGTFVLPASPNQSGSTTFSVNLDNPTLIPSGNNVFLVSADRTIGVYALKQSNTNPVTFAALAYVGELTAAGQTMPSGSWVVPYASGAGSLSIEFDGINPNTPTSAPLVTYDGVVVPAHRYQTKSSFGAGTPFSQLLNGAFIIGSSFEIASYQPYASSASDYAALRPGVIGMPPGNRVRNIMGAQNYDGTGTGYNTEQVLFQAPVPASTVPTSAGLTSWISNGYLTYANKQDLTVTLPAMTAGQLFHCYMFSPLALGERKLPRAELDTYYAVGTGTAPTTPAAINLIGIEDASDRAASNGVGPTPGLIHFTLQATGAVTAGAQAWLRVTLGIE